MLSSLDSYFQPQETALKMRAYRQEVIASNIANADTPGFKARDFDFRAAFNAAREAQKGGSAAAMARTDARHLLPAGGGNDPLLPGLQYRNDRQPSIDGNTVDMNTEMAAFTDNALRYQAAVTFFERRVQSMRTALTGQ